MTVATGPAATDEDLVVGTVVPVVFERVAAQTLGAETAGHVQAECPFPI